MCQEGGVGGEGLGGAGLGVVGGGGGVLDASASQSQTSVINAATRPPVSAGT